MNGKYSKILENLSEYFNHTASLKLLQTKKPRKKWQHIYHLNIFALGFPTVLPMIALCRRPVTTVSHWRCQEGFCAKGLAEEGSNAMRTTGNTGKLSELSENGNTENYGNTCTQTFRDLQGTSWTGRANIRSVQAASENNRLMWSLIKHDKTVSKKKQHPTGGTPPLRN